MKRFTVLLLATALLVPAVALARHGHDESKLRRGVITAYDRDTGELTVETRRGREVTARVTDDTKIRCTGRRVAIARHDRDDDDGDNSGPGKGREDDDHEPDETVTPEPSVSPQPSVSPEPTAAPDDDDRDCEPAEGVAVRRGRVDLDDDVWTKLKLAR